MNDCSICKNYEPVTAKMVGQKAAKENPDVVQVVRCKDCAVPHNHCAGCPRMNGPIMRIEDYPAADVKLAVRGKWKDAVQGAHDSPYVRCSICGEYFWRYFRDFDFCPNCGADMREGE